MSPTVDGCFALKFCINLDRRPERWQAMRRKFAELEIATVERLSATDARSTKVPEHLAHLRPQDYACTMSHLAAVQRARTAGVSEVLIFEDDALFDPDFRPRFAEFIRQLPDDWHMLFLGAYHLSEPVPVSPCIVRARQALTSHAYAVRASLFDEFIAVNENPPAIVDRNNTLLQARFNCYCFQPNLVGQEAGYSDIMERPMPEKPLHHNYPIIGSW
jgi:GR25 family glycosyltransferase involved in LPS biosynthesis